MRRHALPEWQQLSLASVHPFGVFSLDGEKIVDVSGKYWVIRLESKTHVPLSKRIKALLGHEEEIAVSYLFEPEETVSLAEVKRKLLDWSKNDPGDLMWQFVEPERVEAGVASANSFEELFEFVEQKICGGVRA